MTWEDNKQSSGRKLSVWEKQESVTGASGAGEMRRWSRQIEDMLWRASWTLPSSYKFITAFGCHWMFLNIIDFVF